MVEVEAGKGVTKQGILNTDAFGNRHTYMELSVVLEWHFSITSHSNDTIQCSFSFALPRPVLFGDLHIAQMF